MRWGSAGRWEAAETKASADPILSAHPRIYAVKSRRASEARQFALHAEMHFPLPFRFQSSFLAAPMNRTAFLSLGATAALMTGMLFSGCGSAPEPRDLMAEEARGEQTERPVAMKGEGSFADGKLQVFATVSRGFERGKPGSGPIAHRKNSWWRTHETDAFNEKYSFDYGDSEEEQKEAMQDYIRQAMARRAAGSPMPPVTLRVYFENRGTEPMEIAPTDVNSELGNFAVRPPKLSLAPGAQAALDPMISQLGVTNDEIPLTIGIRVGGKSETLVIVVKNIFTATPRK